MNPTRREVLTLAALSTGALSARDPTLGMIFPPAGRSIAEEGLVMYPGGIRFIGEGLGLKTMTPEGYDAVIDLIPPVAKRLKEQGAQAIALMGTSLSFYKGQSFNLKLTNTVKQATGLPATSMSTAVIEGLKALGGHRLAVATAYNDEVNDRLRAFLKEHGFEVLALQGLGVVRVEDINQVTQPQLLEFSARVRESATKADAMLVSCGGLRTLEILAPLEKRVKIPVVSSTPHAVRAGVRLLGLSGHVDGYGSLLAKS